MHSSVFKKGIEKISKFFDRELSDDQLDIYYERIKEISDAVFLEAVDSIIDSSFRFPTPNQFKEYARMFPEDKELPRPPNMSQEDVEKARRFIGRLADKAIRRKA